MGPIQFLHPQAYASHIVVQCLALAFFIADTSWLNANDRITKNRQANHPDWPVPNEPQQLFYLQRDPDINTVVYQVNLQDGEIDNDNPVNIFWIRYTDEEEHRPLNYIQRTMAFGMTHNALENGDFKLELVSYKALPLRLAFDKKTGKHVVYTQINGAQAILDRIYVRIDGGSTFNPNIKYFELSGRQVSSGRKISQRISP